MLTLFSWAMDSLYPGIYARLILFLPLMAVTTIFAFRAEEFSVEHHPVLAALDALGSAFGFGLVICAVSAVRELIGYGTLWEIRVIPEGYQFPQLIGVFSGFILLGFFAAVVQGILQLHRKLRRREQKEESEV
jgi:electron transport complex protein RnfE